MDYLCGIRTDSCVILAADKQNCQSIYVLGDNVNKSWQPAEKTALLCVGEDGDALQFPEYIEKNIQLYKMKNEYELSPKAIAHFARRTIADSLRRSPYFVHLIIGGWDDASKQPYLCMLDYLGTKSEAPYVMHGHGGRFCYSILDNIYKPTWTKDEALEGLKKCLLEVKKRFIINLPNFMVLAVDEKGVHQLDDITV